MLLLIDRNFYKTLCSFLFVGSLAGVLNGHQAEYDAMNFYVNHTSYVNDIPVIFREFKIPTKVDFCRQGKHISIILNTNLIIFSNINKSISLFSKVFTVYLFVWLLYVD